MRKILKVNTPADFCAHIGAACPHPLVCVIDFAELSPVPSSLNNYGVYGIFMHGKVRSDLSYGRGRFEAGNGMLICVAPGQVGGREDDGVPIELDGYALLFHPDLLQGTPLAREIRKFTFFDYSANEALRVTEAEREIVASLMRSIRRETENGPDDEQRDILVHYISVLLHYCNRFYNRQFRTIRRDGEDILVRFSALLEEYFDSGMQLTEGIPGVRYFADKLCMSPSYFSDLVKKGTGENAGNFIRSHIVRIAKNKLVAGGSVSQVAYDLGFEYPQHFSRMFKRQTGMSPKQLK